MRKCHGSDEGQAKPVALGFVPFCEALEDLVEEIGRESRAFVSYLDCMPGFLPR